MKLLRDIKLGYLLVRYAKEVNFNGPCPCGLCDYWMISFRRQRYFTSKLNYRLLRAATK